LPPHPQYVETDAPTTINTILVDEEAIFVGTQQGRGVYRSTDGAIWTALDVGITGPYWPKVKKLVKSESGLLFLAADDGVFVSDNAGERWQTLDMNLPHTNTGYGILLDDFKPTSLFVLRDNSEGQTLAAAFDGEGIWYLTVSPDLLMADLSPQIPPKAVLVVGPIDPPDHDSTNYNIDWANRMAKIMLDNGMRVVKIYWPDSTWENVRAALSGASIVVYKGHGFGIGDMPSDPTEMYGSLNGFCLVHPLDPLGARLGTQDMLVTTNRLAENAIAFFYCCYCAGDSSSDASPVSEALARRRIEAYSSTLLRIGGGGYFSGVNEEGILKDFFKYPNRSLGEIYKDHGGKPEHIYTHILWPDKAVWFDGDTTHGWNRAFVGNPDLTANDILEP
jgi:hypothetical protein